MQKEELEKLKAVMECDEQLPLKKGATKLVFGRGNPKASILMIGEAPGYYEDQQGLPFVGNAGKLLDVTLRENGLDPQKDVYITNVVHHRPPSNRDPLPHELTAYLPYVNKIIEIISPQYIVTLGRYSMAMFLPEVKISRVHGQIFTISGKTIVPMYHPAAALRSEAVMQEFRADFRTFVQKLRTPPHPETKCEDAQLDLFS